MRQKSKVSFGPGAASIILIVVILCMSVLGLLSLMNARNDMHLSRRSAEVVTEVYELSARAEQSLALLDAALPGEQLPDSMTLDGTIVSWTETDDYRELSCAVDISDRDENGHLKWLTHRLEVVTEESTLLWN